MFFLHYVKSGVENEFQIRLILGENRHFQPKFHFW